LELNRQLYGERKDRKEVKKSNENIWEWHEIIIFLSKELNENRKDIVKMNIFTFNNWLNYFNQKIKKEIAETKMIRRR
jgi:hypothetical protein